MNLEREAEKAMRRSQGQERYEWAQVLASLQTWYPPEFNTKET